MGNLRAKALHAGVVLFAGGARRGGLARVGGAGPAGKEKQRHRGGDHGALGRDRRQAGQQLCGVIPRQRDGPGERVGETDPFDAGAGIERNFGFEGARRLVVGADNQDGLFSVLGEDRFEPLPHFDDRRLALPERGRASARGGMPVRGGPLLVDCDHGQCSGFAPFLGQAVEESGERPRGIDREPEAGKPCGQRKQARLRLKMQQGRVACAGRHHRLVAPCQVGIRQGRKFSGEGGGERPAVAVRTGHRDRVERIRLVD